MKWLITNAHIVGKDNLLKKAEILLDGEQISDVGDEGGFSCAQTVDAAGMLVLPGLVDAHVHFRDSGVKHVEQQRKEDFSFGSKAALAGGVTTVLDMPNTIPPTTNLSTYKTKRDNAIKKSYCDFGLYAGAAMDNFSEIPRMLREGAIAVKMYVGSSTGKLLVDDAVNEEKFFALSAENSFVLAIHAEDEECLTWHAKFYESKKSPRHSEVRPAECVEKAVKKGLDYTKKHKNKTYFCHVSTEAESTMIADAKKDGLEVFMEVTPHHLFLDASEQEVQGNRVKVNPPLRSEKDVQALWKDLREGIVDTIATDHAPHLLEEKRQGYWEAPSGVPGLETILSLLVTAALEEKTTFETIQRVCCENPAKIFSLKNKGFLRKGFDADLVFVDLQREKRVEENQLFTRCGWSPFAGKRLRGWPVKTFLRGRLVFDNGQHFGPFGTQLPKYLTEHQVGVGSP